MGQAKKWLIEMEQEKLHKQEKLLDLPNIREESSNQVEELRSQLNYLQSVVTRSNSWQEKYKNFIIGGLIGAAISFLFALII